jgi:ParB family chromosome partitioning protein
MEKRPALGKELRALIPDAPEPRATATEVDINRLAPNEFQPRAHPAEARLDDLAQSIKANGIIQPIIVRSVGDRFQIIAGERRWRAAMKAGLARVPVVIREVAEGERRSLLEVALIENIQRENLNPIEEALAYKSLIEAAGLTQESLAQRVGRDRSYITNYLRLLRLPDDLQKLVQDGRLSTGHARTLLAATDIALQRRLARKIIEKGLSVRDTESLIRRLVSGSGTPKTATRTAISSPAPTMSALPPAANGTISRIGLSG